MEGTDISLPIINANIGIFILKSTLYSVKRAPKYQKSTPKY
jgi:hypothetical protein